MKSIKYEKYEKINYKVAFIKVKKITKLHEKFNKVNQTCNSTGGKKQTKKKHTAREDTTLRDNMTKNKWRKYIPTRENSWMELD